MQTDLQGRVVNESLPLTKGLMPLFEAISNSIDAIRERGNVVGRIVVGIERDVSLLSGGGIHGNFVPDIKNFTVRDNGIGFTEKNFRAFETLDTRTKAKRGGKGIGRLLWLKAFDHAQVESRYAEDARTWERSFEFRLSDAGIENHQKRQLGGAPNAEFETVTVVTLADFKSEYQSHTRKGADHIALAIVEHFLEYFVLHEAPQIEVSDPQQKTDLDLSDLFEEVYKPELDTQRFELAGEPFTLQDVRLRSDGGVEHQVNFCAHNRVVKTVTLKHKIPHLDVPLRSPDGGEVVYAGYVSSPYLDEHVDPSRTDFRIRRRDELSLDGSDLSWEDIEEAVIDRIAESLKPMTEEARRQSRIRVREFVTSKAPRYRVVLKRRPEAVEQIPSEITDERLDLELHQLFQDLKHEVRAEALKQLQLEPEDPSSFEAFRAQREQLYEKLQEVAQSELAEYVLQRNTMLDFFERMLGRESEGDFPLEEALHEIFFPQRATSDDVFYEDHNLWILDERLVYHDYLASDIPFEKQDGPVAVDSKDRPDLVVYNKAVAFTEEELDISSVVIVEFKRPERGDYNASENPIDQVISYVAQLRRGERKRDDGSTIELRENTPFYCYIVATMNPKLRDLAKLRDFVPTPDGLGYFKLHTQYNAYIEILSYRKVLTDAKKRNRAFFDKLQIPTS